MPASLAPPSSVMVISLATSNVEPFLTEIICYEVTVLVIVSLRSCLTVTVEPLYKKRALL